MSVRDSAERPEPRVAPEYLNTLLGAQDEIRCEFEIIEALDSRMMNKSDPRFNLYYKTVEPTREGEKTTYILRNRSILFGLKVVDVDLNKNYSFVKKLYEKYDQAHLDRCIGSMLIDIPFPLWYLIKDQNEMPQDIIDTKNETIFNVISGVLSMRVNSYNILEDITCGNKDRRDIDTEKLIGRRFMGTVVMNASPDSNNEYVYPHMYWDSNIYAPLSNRKYNYQFDYCNVFIPRGGDKHSLEVFNAREEKRNKANTN